jgi:hypothetical protein
MRYTPADTDEKTTYTQDELMAEAKARFGDDPLGFAFICPSCGDIATIREFLEAGDPDMAGQGCIGRLGALKARRPGTVARASPSADATGPRSASSLARGGSSCPTGERSARSGSPRR